MIFHNPGNKEEIDRRIETQKKFLLIENPSLDVSIKFSTNDSKTLTPSSSSSHPRTLERSVISFGDSRECRSGNVGSLKRLTLTWDRSADASFTPKKTFHCSVLTCNRKQRKIIDRLSINRPNNRCARVSKLVNVGTELRCLYSFAYARINGGQRCSASRRIYVYNIAQKIINYGETRTSVNMY